MAIPRPASIVLAAACILAHLPAQCPGAWSPGFGAAGANAAMSKIAAGGSPSGPALYAAGSFSIIGGVPARRVAKWNGTGWSPLGTGINSTIFTAMAVLDAGGGPALYVAGPFADAGGVIVPGLAKWNGSSWSGLPPLPVAGVQVQAFAVFDDGTGPALYVAGAFPPSGLLKLTGNVWSQVPAAPGFSNVVATAMIVADAGGGPRICVVGTVTTPGGTFGFFGRWNGATWEGGLINGTPRTIAAMTGPGGTSIYVGGSFTSAGGIAANNVACVIGPAIGPLGLGTQGPVDSLAAFDDGSGPRLYAAGSFNAAGGAQMAGLARWDGVQWQVPGGSPANCGGNPATASALAVSGSGAGASLYAAGDFLTIGGVAAGRVARWDGAAWHSMGAAGGTSQGIVTMKRSGFLGPDALFVGGNPCFAGTTAVAAVAWYDTAGWHAAPGVFSGFVNALEVFDDGSGPALYAGGSVAIPTPTTLTRWNGVTWSAAGGDVAQSGTIGSVSVNALRVFDDGSGPALFVGGFFDSAGGAPVSNIAKWSGTSWSSLSGGVSGTITPTLQPRALLLEPFDDGTGPALFVAGSFSSAGGLPAAGLAKWNGAWTGIPTGGLSPFTPLQSMAVFDAGTGPALYVTGPFSTIGGVTAPGFAKWTGQAWASVALPPGGSAISGLHVLDDGSGPALYAVVFHLSQPSTRTLERWNGTSWTQLGAFEDAPGIASVGPADLALFDDGSGAALFAAGAFQIAGGVPSSGFAKWATARPTLALSQLVAGAGVTIADSHLVPGRQYYNIFSTSLCAAVGLGPYAGLCAPDPTPLFAQFLLPLGAAPFHFAAGSSSATFGPFPAPAGLVFDGVCFDFTGGALGCRSPVVRFQVQ